ncbi:hypothetical protein [Mycolicibacterium peregrinum]|uniref:hypothetical protein n=1 Tax=Mycolicibacterium peregrinum TaxID=43304 RepID=UPI0009EF4FE6|nr:hypothetical protein [Mycolicibacterium peregrinum]
MRQSAVTRKTFVRTAFSGLAALAVIGSAAACASGESTDSPTQAAQSSTQAPMSSSGQPSAPVTPDAFGQCMQEHGIPAPPEGTPGAPGGPEHPGGPGHHPDGPPPGGSDSPPPGAGATPPAPPGVDQAQWEDAMQSCQSLAPHPPPQ